MAMQNRVIRSSNGREPGGTGNSRFALFIFLGSYALVFVTLAIVVINLRRVSFDWRRPLLKADWMSFTLLRPPVQLTFVVIFGGESARDAFGVETRADREMANARAMRAIRMG